MAQLTTYAAVGDREGLTDTVAELFADDAPLFAMSNKKDAIATYHEWQTDALAASNTAGSVEGATISYTAPAGRARVGNYTHIKERSWEVTFSQVAAKTAGVKDEVARAVMKAMKEIVTDYEAIFLDENAAVAGDASTAREAAGLVTAITTNATDKAAAQVTEDDVNALLESVWTAGGDPKALFCGGFNKRVISKTFTTSNTFNIEASTRKSIQNITEYEGSFGTLQVIPDRFIAADDIVITTPEQISIAILRDIEQFDGAQTSSSIKGWVEGEMTLEYGNEKAHAKITSTTTSGAIS